MQDLLGLPHMFLALAESIHVYTVCLTKWRGQSTLCLLYTDFDKDKVFAHLSTDCPCEVE